MLTQMLDKASEVMRVEFMLDTASIYTPGEVRTVDFVDTRELQLKLSAVPCLIQTVSIPDANQSTTQVYYSIKFDKNVNVEPGDYVTIIRCEREPGLESKTLLVDNVSANGMAVIKKAVAKEFVTVGGQVKQ